MLAASIVEKSIGGPRRRPATKKSLVLRTRRPIARPTAICARQKTAAASGASSGAHANV
jgi:hypothetical protein